jgi:predicted amidohydrolase
VKTVLAPVRIEAGDTRRNIQALTQRVDELCAEADLIVFPQMPLRAPGEEGGGDSSKGDSLSHVFSDLMSQLAREHGTYIAAGFLERRGSVGSETLLLADPGGLLTVRSCGVAVSKAENVSRPEPISVFVRDAKIVLAPLGNLSDPGLVVNLRESGADALVVPMHLTGRSPGEYRRIAVHNPPAALAGLRSLFAAIARAARCRVAAVNAIGQDLPGGECGPCGGVFVYDLQGCAVVEQTLYKETPYCLEVNPSGQTRE